MNAYMMPTYLQCIELAKIEVNNDQSKDSRHTESGIGVNDKEETCKMNEHKRAKS